MSSTTKSRWRRPVGAALLLLLVLACAAPPTNAREPDERERRRVASIREVDLPTTSLELDEGCIVAEGPRMLRDRFPYLVARRGEGETFLLTPKNLGAFLARSPQEGGHAPAAIRTEKAAIEAVRLFVPGAFVTSSGQAARIVAAARECAAGFEHLKPKFTDHEPKSYAVTAKPLPQDRSMHPVEVFTVSLVALEMDNYLALVHITARVRANGEIEMDRKLIVDGPMLSWQSATIGEPSPEFQRQQEEMYAEAALARKRDGPVWK